MGDIIDLNLKFSWEISSVNVELVLDVSENFSLSVSSVANVMTIVFTRCIYAQSFYLSGRIIDHMTQPALFILSVALPLHPVPCLDISMNSTTHMYWCKFTQYKLKECVRFFNIIIYTGQVGLVLYAGAGTSFENSCEQLCHGKEFC
jgi:hypothetical protein